MEERVLNFAFSDGSYKKTHSNRFDDFDEKIISYLKKNLTKDKKYKFHDLAISDGRTSVDLFSKLEKIFPSLDFFASDKNMFAYAFYDIRNKSRRIIKDENGKILQIVVPPFVLNVYSPKKALRFKIKKALLYPVNFILLNLLLIPFIRNIFIKNIGGEKQKITLIQNRALDLINSRENFHVASYDMFQKNPDEFDIIRAMNVLNFSYFTNDEVKKIISNILSSLKEGGLFIVGSNKAAATPVNGDLLIKKNGRFESLEKFGEGAPFREIILSL